MGDFRKTALRLAAAFAAVFLAAHAAAQEFSDVRMREGDAAYRARRFAEAASFYRVAAFGYLDRPPMLCQALVRLSLAADAAGRPTDVKAAMDRLADAQRRAPSCGDAEIDAATRSDFETRFHRRWRGGEIPRAVAASETVPAGAPPSSAADASAALPRPSRPAFRAGPEPSPQAASRETELEQGGARLKTVVHPVYPRSALAAHVGGVVILRVLVSEEGAPLQVEVVQGIRPDLNAAAVTAIKRCVFEPARVAGRPVRSSTTVSVPFQP